ncbi:uncharacterized protein LOC106661023 [Cimex lectularius]|uniref:Uncharacterized protein n=1 Tax=Cimex lectularius TaxID=79782 RepID=A0A8I6SE52_CIMLE|nr:uncharacterized protein LOC106661023 [Cimex lectularius]
MSAASKMLFLLVLITLILGSQSIRKKMSSKDLPVLPSVISKDETPRHLLIKEKGNCYRYERRIAVDGCNMCYCDLTHFKFTCTTRVCIYNARMKIQPGNRCFFPRAIYVGYKHTSCRCGEEGELYNCLSRLPSKKSLMISSRRNPLRI